MSNRLRIGIVGLGFGRRVLLPVFQAAQRCEVVGVCANGWEHTRQVAEQFGIAAYRNWEALVDDSSIDAVVIATPPSLHHSIAVAALGLRKHVFCEKPLADSLDAAKSMTLAARRAGAAHMVDFEFPDMVGWQDARTIVASGALGRLRHVRVSWSGETYANRVGLESWKRHAASGGGALNDFASHCFYNVEWLLGPIRSVWTAPISQIDRERDGDTLAVLSLELGDGTTVSAFVQTSAFLGDGHAVTIHGDDGTLRLINPKDDVAGAFSLFVGTRKTGRLAPVNLAAPSVPTSDYRIPAVGRLVERFLDWGLMARPERPNFEDGLRVQALVDAAWRSRNEGAWREVAPTDSVAALK